MLILPAFQVYLICHRPRVKARGSLVLQKSLDFVLSIGLAVLVAAGSWQWTQQVHWPVAQHLLAAAVAAFAIQYAFYAKLQRHSRSTDLV
ncbi:MAG: hypothetical protein HOE86_11470 [Gemmatimonadetes bacterium]|nr:hypothetical protein [Gemmatimonadota bacterium]